VGETEHDAVPSKLLDPPKDVQILNFKPGMRSGQFYDAEIVKCGMSFHACQVGITQSCILVRPYTKTCIERDLHLLRVQATVEVPHTVASVQNFCYSIAGNR